MDTGVPRDLEGKTALVTGGARGIGRAICLELANRGANVAINYHRRADSAREVAMAVRERSVAALTVQADVSDKGAVRAMVETVAHDLDVPEILVNNAGLLRMGQLLDYDESEYDSMWRTNVNGVLNCSAAVAPGMIERSWGRIVNLSSIAAIGTTVPTTTLYAVTKGAVLTLTKRMALELSPSGITVNAVLPGFIKTDMVLAGKTPDEAERLVATAARKSLIGRAGEPEDIAQVVGFLCSPASSFMTGQFLSSDGGRQDYLTRV